MGYRRSEGMYLFFVAQVVSFLKISDYKGALYCEYSGTFVDFVRSSREL